MPKNIINKSKSIRKQPDPLAGKKNTKANGRRLTKEEEDAIIFALLFEGTGKRHVGTGRGIPLDGDEISRKIKSKALAWVHFDGTAPGTREWIKKEVGYLDDIIIDALLADETRPRMLEHGNGVLLILRGVNLNEGADAEDMVSIRLWADPHRIISIQIRSLKAVYDIREQLEKGVGPKSVGDFVVTLATRLFDLMKPVLHSLDEATDSVEERVMEDPDASLRRIVTNIRRKAIIFRRYISPQRDVVAHLRLSEQKWLTPLHRRQLQEDHDHLQRYVEDLDSVRERTQIVKDELINALASKQNQHIHMVSVFTAIFLPLGFLTGLFGINIAGLPGVKNPNAFWDFTLVLVFVVLFQIWFFKKHKWF